MGDNSEDLSDDLADDAGGDAASGKKRGRTQIEFAYTDEERAADLAVALHQLAGSAWIDSGQLAVALNQTATGGTFRTRLSAARMFGFIETDQGRVRLTSLGLQLSDPQTAVGARAEAFTNVPLFSEMYTRYQGYALPPPAAIERQMEQLGVPPKQKERARQAFASSAQYAGYIAANGRFSKPVIPNAANAAPVAPDRSEQKNNGGGGNGGGRDLHPFIQGLLDQLPKPGSEWPAEDRTTWLRGAEIIFKMMYTGGGEITISEPKKTKPPEGGFE